MLSKSFSLIWVKKEVLKEILEAASTSVTRWLDLFLIYGHLEQWNFAQKYEIFAKLGS